MPNHKNKHSFSAIQVDFHKFGILTLDVERRTDTSQMMNTMP